MTHSKGCGRCLIAIGVLFLLIVTAASVLSICWNRYWYEEDNAKRRDPMENLAHFHRELQGYLAAHDGRYPAEQGVHGLGELVVFLSDLRVKDDKNVGIDPDYLSEQITSYAYVASGLSATDMDGDMPVIFEKPWRRRRIRVLLSDGRVEVLEDKGFKTCREVVAYYQERSKTTSAAWETLLNNAEYIDTSGIRP